MQRPVRNSSRMSMNARACNRGDPFLPLSPLTAARGAHMPDDHHLSQARERNSLSGVSGQDQAKKNNPDKNKTGLINAKHKEKKSHNSFTYTSRFVSKPILDKKGRINYKVKFRRNKKLNFSTKKKNVPVSGPPSHLNICRAARRLR